MTFMGHSLPESTDMPLQTTVTCSQCDFEAKDHAALAVHQSKRHGARIAMRRMLCDSVCRACGVQYHTRPRALQHLHTGTTRCWLWHMRAYEPMDDAQAFALDEQDKTAKVAHHQRGIKSLTQDFHCRPATDQELQVNALQPKEHGDPHWEDPTEQELQEWSAVGLLPPGQGGRQKTSRGQCQPHVKHVIADTQMFEARMLERATEWMLGANSVPKPLTDGRKFALLLIAGHRREGDMAAWLEWQSDIIPLSVDLAVDAFHGDVCKSHLWEGLVRAGKVVAAHAAPPCETYTTARWLEQPDGEGPRPLRDALHPWGMLSRSVPEVAQSELGTKLMMEALYLVLLVFAWGGCFTAEHPRGPLTNEIHWSIWYSGFIREMCQVPGIPAGAIRPPIREAYNPGSRKTSSPSAAVVFLLPKRLEADEQAGGKRRAPLAHGTGQNLSGGNVQNSFPSIHQLRQWCRL